MSKFPWRSCLLASALVLAGCSSAPVHYYTLLQPAAAAPAVAQAGYLIEVLPVGVPEAQDRQGLVVRTGNSQVAMLDRERWAGPLADEVRAALSSQLSAKLGARDATGLAKPADAKVLRVKLDLRRLDAWLGQRVDVTADWSVGWADKPGERLVCSSKLSVPAPGDASALVEAYQQALAQLAGQIASQHCP